MATIKGVKAEGFKGLNFDTALNPRTLIVGPNGEGKSAITQAAQLVLRGYVPGGPKKNEEILSTYGDGQDMSVAVKVGALMFGRQFVRDSKGAVTQVYEINGTKAAKEYFQRSLGEAGAPRVIDFAAFMALSDQKIIDEIFRLFPPGEGIDKIDADLTKKKESLNNLRQTLKTLEGTQKRLTEARRNIELPAGGIGEVEAEIKKLEGEAKAKQTELDAKRIAEAEAKAVVAEKERAERAAYAKKKADEAEAEKARIKAAEEKEKARAKQEAEKGKLLSDFVDVMKTDNLLPDDKPEEATATGEPERSVYCPDVLISLTRIQSAMERAGCSTCAAMMIVKSEIRKYQGV